MTKEIGKMSIPVGHVSERNIIKKEKNESCDGYRKDDEPSSNIPSFKTISECVSKKSEKGLIKLWRYDLSNHAMNPPFCISPDGKTFVATFSHDIVSFNPQKGKRNWIFENNDLRVGIETPPQVGGDGNVYAGFRYADGVKIVDGIIALDGETGRKKWERKALNYESLLVGKDETVYIGSDNGKFYAIDGKKGENIWEFEVEYPMKRPPFLGADGTVYIDGGRGKLCALNGKTGEKVWDCQVNNKFLSSSPCFASNGNIYIGGDGGINGSKLYAVDSKIGVKRWESDMSLWVMHTPQFGADGNVYVLDNDKTIFAINGETGEELWKFCNGYVIDSPPSISNDGMVCFGCRDTKIYALNAETGKVEWQYETQGKVRPSPKISDDGIVYAGSDDGFVYLFESKSGELLEKYKPLESGKIENSLIIDNNGVVYVMSSLGVDRIAAIKYSKGSADNDK